MSNRSDALWENAALALEPARASGSKDLFAKEEPTHVASAPWSLPMPSRVVRILRALIVFLTVAVLGGCVVSDENKIRKPEVVNGVLKIPFSSHNFSAACFDTLKCTVIYSRRYAVKMDGPSSSLTAAVRKNLDGAWAGIPNFPPPAHVIWTAKDGTDHEAHVDIATIFKDQHFFYAPDLDVHDVPLDRRFLDPGIVLVIENRTINVFMRAVIPLSHQAIAGNPYSNFRNDLVLAFSQDY